MTIRASLKMLPSPSDPRCLHLAIRWLPPSHDLVGPRIRFAFCCMEPIGTAAHYCFSCRSYETWWFTYLAGGYFAWVAAKLAPCGPFVPGTKRWAQRDGSVRFLNRFEYEHIHTSLHYWKRVGHHILACPSINSSQPPSPLPSPLIHLPLLIQYQTFLFYLELLLQMIFTRLPKHRSSYTTETAM